MTEWGMLLLCTYIALGATGRLTWRQAGGAALAVTVIVIGVVLVNYSSTTPTDKYVRAVDAMVYATGNEDQARRISGGPPSTEDQTGVTAATWLSTDHSASDTGSGSSDNGGGG
jgi:hypothetical protein